MAADTVFVTDHLLQIDTLLTADSVEWCPTPGLEGVLGCGTYQLNQQDNSRLGSLMLFSWDGNKLTRILESAANKYSFGILDMKWKTIEGTASLAAATSNATVQYLQLQGPQEELALRDLGEFQLEKQGSTQTSGPHLSLSLDWEKLNHSTIVSDSLGQVWLAEWCDSAPRLSRCWRAHSYEAWIACFGQDERQVLSGGDDCKLCVWDLRTDTSRASLVSKWHKMGVCSLQIHPSADKSHLLASGSYDESFALWDVRHMTTPLKERSLGGGIWRIKWCPHTQHPTLAAAACMHNHFSVLDTHLDSAQPVQVVGRYEGHSSLCYGVDWHRGGGVNRGEEDKHTFTLASCSFYDHSMHLWNMVV